MSEMVIQSNLCAAGMPSMSGHGQLADRAPYCKARRAMLNKHALVWPGFGNNSVQPGRSSSRCTKKGCQLATCGRAGIAATQGRQQARQLLAGHLAIPYRAVSAVAELISH